MSCTYVKHMNCMVLGNKQYSTMQLFTGNGLLPVYKIFLN